MNRSSPHYIYILSYKRWITKDVTCASPMQRTGNKSKKLHQAVNGMLVLVRPLLLSSCWADGAITIMLVLMLAIVIVVVMLVLVLAVIVVLVVGGVGDICHCGVVVELLFLLLSLSCWSWS